MAQAPAPPSRNGSAERAPPDEGAGPPPLKRPRAGTVPLEDDGDRVPAKPDPRGLQTFRVQDAGIQCIAAPCPTYVAQRMVGNQLSDELQIHEVDLSALSKQDRERATKGMAQGGQGIPLQGRLRTLPNRGPAGDAVVLVVERLGKAR